MRAFPYIILIFAISFAMHFTVFHKDLIGFHVWRQTETQTVINNFIQEQGTFTRPQRNDIAENNGTHIREFPLMQYGFALVAKTCGGKPYVVSRILSFLMGCISITGFFLLSLSLFRSKKFALLAAWAICFSPVFYYYTLNPLPDNAALCCSIFSLHFAVMWHKYSRTRWLILSLALLSMATLIKLPFILTGATLFMLILYQFKSPQKPTRKAFIAALALLFLMPPVLWYAYSIPFWQGVGVKKGILEGFTASDSIDIIFHNLVSTLPELFINYAAMPAFIIGFYVIFFRTGKTLLKQAFLLQLIALTAYFLFEHNMIGKIHDYYLLPFLPLTALTVVYGVKKTLEWKNPVIKYIVLFGILIMPLTAFLRINTRWNEKDPGFSPGFYTQKEKLRSISPKNALFITGEDESQYIQLYYLDRKGFTYSKQNFSEPTMNKWIKAGASYFVTDKDYDTLSFVKNKLGEKIFDQDNIRVYKLRYTDE